MLKYGLTLEVLEENCFPRAHPDVKGKAIVKTVRMGGWRGLGVGV